MKFQFDKSLEFLRFSNFLIKLKIRLASGQKRLKMRICWKFSKIFEIREI